MEHALDDPFQETEKYPPYDASKVVELRCINCPEITTISDDPKNRADWVAYAIDRDGWAETLDGLICPNCGLHRLSAS